MSPTILVLHQGAIGDFVLTMAVVQAVRESTDGNRVIAIASASSARISAGRSVIDEWHSPESMGLHRLFGEESEIDERLRNVLNRADLVLNFLGDLQSSPQRRLAAIFEPPRRQDRQDKKIIAIDPRPTPETENSGRHITQQWAESIRSQGLNIGEPSPPRIRMDANAEKNRVVIHPGSGGRGKCWPIENFIRIADSLADKDVNWMLGPAEIENPPLNKSKTRCGEGGQGGVGTTTMFHIKDDMIKDNTQLICEDDLLEALQRIAGASLYIGNDAGMTHLAAAIGLPTIAIFGPTDPRIWRPLGPNVHVVEPLEGRAIDRVSVGQVLAAIHALRRSG